MSAIYTVEHRGNCILVSGSVPISAFGKLTELAPPDSVTSPHLARIAGVTFAFGPLADTKALAESMHEHAIECARFTYKHTGLSDDAIRWLAIGEHGSSSLAIFYKLTGVKPVGVSVGVNHPLYPDDLSCCRKLLEQVPELGMRIGEMSSVSMYWAKLAPQWSLLCRTMDEESPDWRNGNGSSKNTYKLMDDIFKDVL